MRILSSSEKKRNEIGEKIRNSRSDTETIPLKNDLPERILKGSLIFLAGLMIVLIVWSVVAWWYNTYHAYSLTFPEPAETLRQLWSYLTGEKMFTVSIYTHLSASLQRWMMGYAIAALLGLIAGMILGLSEKIHDVLIVPVNIVQMIPGLAWIPVALLLFGLGNNSAIFIIAVSAVAPVIINTATGIRRVPRVNIRTAQMVGVSRTKMFDTVLLPFATVDIITGMRIGMANAWRVLIAAEMVVGVVVGLGYGIDQAIYMNDYVTSFVCIILICVIGLFIEKVVFARIERYAKEKLGAEVGQ